VDGKRAFPLGESGRPARRTGGTANERAGYLTTIIDWLDVERSARHQRRGATTYCNIHACDYCYLADAYLPRVWWSEGAVRRLSEGQSVRPEYGNTVFELSANRLLVWLLDFGPEFGWRRTFNPGDLQAATNRGEVGVIVAQRRDVHRPGHISVVVPETNVRRSVRAAGPSRSPSRAGRASRTRSTSRRAWWTHSRFAQFGFWINA
jgi:hypothetical protein